MRGLGLLSLLALVVGCKNPDDELEPAFVPKTYAFEGEIAPKFAGTWVSTDGVSTLDLGKDGTLKIQTLTSSPSGKAKSNVAGKWLASGGNLLLNYKEASGGETTLGYAAALAGEKLTLQQNGGGRKTTYVRK